MDLTFTMLWNGACLGEGSRFLPFIRKGKKNFIIPGPDLAYEVYPRKPCLRFIKKAPMKFGNLAPGPACKSCLTKGICICARLPMPLCTDATIRAYELFAYFLMILPSLTPSQSLILSNRDGPFTSNVHSAFLSSSMLVARAV